jgi:hypothetical protein
VLLRVSRFEQRVHLPLTPGVAAMGSWIAIGLALGVAIGSMYDNLAIGIAIGLALGVAFGGYRKRKQ